MFPSSKTRSQIDFHLGGKFYETHVLGLFLGYMVNSLLDEGLQRGSFGTVHTSGSHPRSFTTSCASIGILLNYRDL